jgi:aminoglycoside 6-adenylyltransferase
MRSEQEMLDLILDTARNDERIRAVVINGSRANPNAPHDRFQDFDIVYIVTDVAPFRHNLDWIKRFGELMILQMPDEMDDPPSDNAGGFTYLMQFADGNRIDLGIDPPAMLPELVKDSQSILLLDKDGIVPKMLNWWVGVETGFAANPGKFGKYLQRYLAPDLWELLLKTYADASYERTWEALFAMCELFRIIALRVAAHFGFDYPHEDDVRVSAHLRRVRLLPKDAQEIY